HDRVRAEIADTGLHVQLAVRTDRHQAVESDRSGSVRADGDADAAYLCASALARIGLAFVPPERLLAALERFGDERARQARTLAVRPCGSERGTSNRRVDLPDLDLIDPKLLRGLGNQRFDHPVGLHRSGRPLLRP